MNATEFVFQDGGHEIDWIDPVPASSRVRVEKSSLTGDRLKITDTRTDWSDT